MNGMGNWDWDFTNKKKKPTWNVDKLAILFFLTNFMSILKIFGGYVKSLVMYQMCIFPINCLNLGNILFSYGLSKSKTWGN